MLNIIFTICYLAISFIGVTGNLFVIVVLRNVQQKNITNLFLFNLAIADLGLDLIGYIWCSEFLDENFILKEIIERILLFIFLSFYGNTSLLGC